MYTLLLSTTIPLGVLDVKMLAEVFRGEMGWAHRFNGWSGRALGVLGIFLFLCFGVAWGESVRIGVYEMPPQVFTGADGKLHGLFPELMEKISAQNGWDVQYIQGSRAACLEQLQDGVLDLVVDAVGGNEAGKYCCSETVFIDWDGAFSRSGLSIESLSDLRGLRVLTLGGNGDAVAKLLRDQQIDCVVDVVGSYDEIMFLLEAQGADVGFVNNLYGMRHGSRFHVQATPLLVNPHSCCFLADAQSAAGVALVKQISSSLRAMKEDPESRYNQSLSYYMCGGQGSRIFSEEHFSSRLELTSDERAWIEKHPVVRIGVDPEFMPYEFIDEQQRNEGMASDWLQLISRRTGIQFQLVKKELWADSVEAIKAKEIDLLPCIGVSKERGDFLQFTDSYLSFSRILVTRNDVHVDSLEDLKGKRLAVQSNSSHHEFVKQFDGFEVCLYPTYKEALMAVSRGEVDATVGNLAVTMHCLRKFMLTNIKMAAYASADSNPLCMGVRDDWPELVSILNRAIHSISLQERNEIYDKWVPLQKPIDGRISLTEEERDWLLLHPRINVCWDPNWAPVEFADSEGVPRGISMDYLQTLEKMLGVEFVPISTTSWQEAYAMLQNGELDMASCLSPTEQRLAFLDFTESYFNSPSVFFARNDMVYIRGMNDLEKLRVVVVKDYATDEWITRNYPQIQPIRAKDVDHAFTLLEQEAADVFIGNVVVGNYYLSKNRIQGIKIVGEAPHSYTLRMAVRKDWPIFTRILSKAIRTIPEEDKTSFYRKWVWIEYEHEFDYSLLWKTLLLCAAIILAFLAWNRRLAKEVRSRKSAEKALAESREKLSANYDELMELEKMKEDLVHMVVHDMRTPLQSVYSALEMLKYEKEKEGTVEGEFVDYIRLAKESSKMLNTMTQDLLDVSQLETNKMQLFCSDQSLLIVVKKAVNSVSMQLKERGCRVEIEGDASASIDENIIGRVLVNLISNALKASPENCSIQIKIGVNSGTPSFCVQDHGCGIPEEMQERVFDKFARIKTEHKPAIPSVGLGLTFCKLAVESHGGSIRVESVVGEGTTFFIKLPAPEKDVESNAE